MYEKKGEIGLPITGKDREEMLQTLNDHWRLEEGRYIANIEDVNLVTVSDGRRPLCWDLSLSDTKRMIKKFHWIDREGGVNFLINDLQGLGMNTTSENAITLCNSLIGCKIEIDIRYNGEYQNITFLRRIQ